MDTGSVQAIVGVATQGKPTLQSSSHQFVSSYTVSVSNDASSWTQVDGGVTFPGNVDWGEAVVRNDFAAVVTARYVRIEPVTWHNFICMRAGVYIDER